MEFKRDPFVLGAAVLALAGLGFLFYKHAIDWMTVVGGVVLLGIPSLFGKSKDGAS